MSMSYKERLAEQWLTMMTLVEMLLAEDRDKHGKMRVARTVLWAMRDETEEALKHMKEE